MVKIYSSSGYGIVYANKWHVTIFRKEGVRRTRVYTSRKMLDIINNTKNIAR